MIEKERQRWAIGLIIGATLISLAFVFMAQNEGASTVPDQTNDEMEVAPS